LENEPALIKKNEIALADLPRLSGKRYLLYGSSLMVFKYIVDTLLCTYVFHHAWRVSEYFVPGALSDPSWFAAGPAGIAGETTIFYGSMLLAALPFAYLGSVLTLRRLRAIGLPPWLVILFYVPFINMVFFTILTVVESSPSSGTSLLDEQPEPPAIEGHETPSAITSEVAPTIAPAVLQAPSPARLETPTPSSPPAPPSTAVQGGEGKVVSLGEWKPRQSTESPSQTYPLKLAGTGQEKFLALMDKLPEDGWKALLAAAALPVPIAVIAALFSVSILGTYGWTVFTAIPFIASIAAAILFGWRKKRDILECMQVSVVSLLIMACVLLLIPFEGVICLIMAAPLAIGIGVVGGAVGYIIQVNLPRSESMPRLMGCFAIILPLLIAGEYLTPTEVPEYKNVDTIEIAAPPAVVWKYLIDFPPIGPPTDWVFKTGIAYPMRARIEGRGVGAIRHCIFTTGEFVEPINVWDAPHQLRFGVLAQAPPMHELSLYPNLHPPHLDNYLVARQGQFLLTDTPSGKTKLEGATWYQNYMGPSPYWRIWSDWIIHRIHLRVMNHVKALAEKEAAM
jgi:uncharacterized membrane protein YhaH (DUF805 family)